MKVSMARIRLYLKEGKTLANGTHPIMLMVSFNGRKEVSTGFSCTPMALATLLGRSPNTLAQYISELTEETDLAIAVDVV